MRFRPALFPRAARAAASVVFALLCAAAMAHGFSVGAIAIDHPFATPSIAGTSNGAAYLASLQNKGTAPERLVGASTPAAARVELHTMSVDAQGVMRMREVDGIALAPKAKVEMRPGTGLHLMLVGLKAPLREGTSFPMKLQFEHAGPLDVSVVVEAPKLPEPAASAPKHTH